MAGKKQFITLESLQATQGWKCFFVFLCLEIDIINISAKSMWLYPDAAGRGFMNRSIERERERERDIWHRSGNNSCNASYLLWIMRADWKMSRSSLNKKGK